MKVLSSESYRAVKNIRIILKDSGVVDVFAEYPAKDVAFSLLALSRLQHFKSSANNLPKASGSGRSSHADLDTDTVTEVDNSVTSLLSSSDNDDNMEEQLIHDLVHYAVFANASYGWMLGLLPDRFHWTKFAALSRKTGIQRHNIIAANWTAKTFLPVGEWYYS